MSNKGLKIYPQKVENILLLIQSLKGILKPGSIPPELQFKEKDNMLTLKTPKSAR